MTSTPETAAHPDAAPRPRVVIAVDLPEELCARIEQAEPRVEVVRAHELLEHGHTRGKLILDVRA